MTARAVLYASVSLITLPWGSGIIFHIGQVNRCRLTKEIVSHTPPAQAKATTIGIKLTIVTLVSPIYEKPLQNKNYI